MQQEATLETLAAEAYAAFETAERPAGEGTYIRLVDTAPQWVTDLVYHAHDGMLPDDWRYNAIQDALEALADGADPDDGAEYADGQVDGYTAKRVAWLASHGARVDYTDEALNEYGDDYRGGILAALALGQYHEASQVWALVVEALHERLETVEDERED